MVKRLKPEDRKFYKKGFLIEGDQIKVVVDFGQGLNIYSNSIKTKTINVNGKFTKKNINKFHSVRKQTLNTKLE